MSRKPNWVLIPIHNNPQLLNQALDSILDQSVGDIRILAVDNASVIPVYPVLNQRLGNEHIVVTYRPQLGVAGAWNFGLKFLFNHGIDQVLVVNQDVVLPRYLYQTLKEDGGQFVTAKSVLNMEEMPEYHKPTERRPHPDFSCYLIRKSCYELTGEFDEGFYPAWFEDNDYHIRMAQKGILAYCLDLPYYHYAAATMKHADRREIDADLNPGFVNSKKRFFQKWNVLPGTPEYEVMCDPSYWNTYTATGQPVRAA